MKSLIIAFALGIGVCGFAQETTPKPTRSDIAKMTPEQRQEKHLAHLTKELNLDAKQKEAVGKILAEKKDKFQSLNSQKHTRRQGGQPLTIEEKEALKKKMTAEKEDTEKQMKAILSADQYKKWETLREENVEKLKERTPKSTRSNIEKPTPEQRQEKYLAHLTKELNLDAKQKEAVGKILAEKSDKAQNLKSQKAERNENTQKLTPAEKEALKAKLKAEKADTEARMKAILTADQYTKWQTIREDNKEKLIEKRREKRGI
ncbi:hypothetical protein [Flavobacterium sp.]|uniref:hypothetical protein n=1 Tax=Flavobacterium sp. TaxID=239 RepID=UPI002C592692|nr:hypothetical protein [Flavobacterium sp.]HSD06096.1 hypothetical protein [Flavobacterium sp.]